MKLKPKHSIADYFERIEDPRIDRRKQHKLIDIITHIPHFKFYDKDYQLKLS